MIPPTVSEIYIIFITDFLLLEIAGPNSKSLVGFGIEQRQSMHQLSQLIFVANKPSTAPFDPEDLMSIWFETMDCNRLWHGLMMSLYRPKRAEMTTNFS